MAAERIMISIPTELLIELDKYATIKGMEETGQALTRSTVIQRAIKKLVQ